MRVMVTDELLDYLADRYNKISGQLKTVTFAEYVEMWIYRKERILSEWQG